ncbi:unnamed protein product [Rhizophagus irregularis]|nr:unnamed protein product [Rhizophagus irregularis]
MRNLIKKLTTKNCKNCIKCGEINYTQYYWCKSCRINYFKRFKNLTSGNEKIDNFIQKMQLKFDGPFDIGFEWIPYNQFDDVKEINKGDLATTYTAIWNNGPLYWRSWNECKRDPYKNECNRQLMWTFIY